MNIKLFPLALAIALFKWAMYLITDESLHPDYIGFGLLLMFPVGLCLVRAFDPWLERLAQYLGK